MQLKSLVHTLAALTLLGAPTAALAQGDQNNGTWQQNQQNGQWNRNGQWNQNGRRDRERDARDRDERNRDARANAEERRREEERRERERDRNRGYNNGGYNGGYNNGGYNYPNGGYNYPNGNYGGYNNGGYNNGVGRNGEIDGVVSQFSSFNLDLNRGPHVHLHQGTVINPTGTTLAPGMRVAVYGHPNGDGTFEADQINVVGNGNYGTNNGNNPYGRWGNILGRFGL